MTQEIQEDSTMDGVESLGSDLLEDRKTLVLYSSGVIF